MAYADDAVYIFDYFDFLHTWFIWENESNGGTINLISKQYKLKTTTVKEVYPINAHPIYIYIYMALYAWIVNCDKSINYDRFESTMKKI